MSHQLISLLQQWYPHRDDSDWVLGVLFQTLGSAYRKAGALMLFGAEGKQLGMLSGGCLESDLHGKARRVMASQQSKIITYDGSDEDDMSFQMGIGCGGRVDVMLQVINADNNYLGLTGLLEQLQSDQPATLSITIGEGVAPTDHDSVVQAGATLSMPFTFEKNRLTIAATPAPHLFIAGGGIDARPLVEIANTLGWCITLWDPRPAHGRREHFPKVHHLFKGSSDEVRQFLARKPCDGAIAMTHSVTLDAEILAILAPLHPTYLALLGPEHRLQQVIDVADIERPKQLAGPAGLSIGGTLPETIALSILAECQAAFGGRRGGSMSGVL
jgi:xanthine dehydrogenase accessory factor